MKLIPFEIKKILSVKILLIFLFIFLLNAGLFYIHIIPTIPTSIEKEEYNIWKEKLDKNGTTEQKLEVCEQTIYDLMDVQSGLIVDEFLSKEEVERIQKIYENTIYYTDEEVLQAALTALSELEKEYRDILDYDSFISNLEKRANRMLEFPIFAEDGSFSKRNIIKTAKDFKGLEDISLNPTNQKGFVKLKDFYITDILILVFLCLLCFQENGKDEKLGMQSLIRATKNGKGLLRFSQMGAICLLIVASGILFYGSNLIQTGAFLGFGESDTLVQSMAVFRNVPFICTVGTFLTIFLVWKIAMLLVCVAFCHFVAVKLGGEKLAWMLIGIVFLISFLLWFYIPISPVTKIFRYLNVFGIFDVGEIWGYYQNLNFFGFPVSLHMGASIFGGIIFLVTAIAAIVVEKSEWRLPSITFFKHKKWKRRTSTKVIVYEWYKVFWNQKVWIILLAVAFISIREFDIEKVLYTQRQYAYEHYINTYRGVLTEDKKIAIEEEIAKKDTMDVIQRDAIEKIEVQYENLKNLEERNIKGGFVSRFFLNHFFFEENIDSKKGMLLTLALLLSLAGIFYQDTKNQMIHLLRTTKQNHKIYNSKLTIAAMLGSIYTILLWGPYYVSYFIRYGTQSLELPIQSLPEFSSISIPITIASYMVITMLIRILIGAMLGVVIAFLGQFLQLPTNAIVCGVILIVFPLGLLTLGSMQYPYNVLIRFINTTLKPYLKPIDFLVSFNLMYGKGIGLMALFWIGIVVVLFIISSYCYKKKTSS